MTANFLYATGGSGSGGYIVPTFNILQSELNGTVNAAFSALGTQRTQADTGQAIWGYVGFKSGGAFQSTSGGSISVYWLTSPDGGTNYEAYSGSATQGVIARQPDVVIPFNATSYVSGNIVYAPGLVRLWAPVTKPIAYNNTNTTLAATSNAIFVSPVAVQY